MPNTPFNVTTFTWFSVLNISASACRRIRSPSANVRLRRTFRFRMLWPSPALRLMNTPLMVGRAAVPWIVLAPVVMLNGSGEYAVSEVVSWNPWLKRSHGVFAFSSEE